MNKYMKTFEDFKIDGKKILFSKKELIKLYGIAIELDYDFKSHGNGYFNGFFRIEKGRRMVVLSSQNVNHKSEFYVYDTYDDFNTKIFKKEISTVDEFISLLKDFEDEELFYKKYNLYTTSAWASRSAKKI